MIENSGPAAVIAGRRRRQLAARPELVRDYRKVKGDARARLDELLARAIATLRAKQCEVYLADDAAGACELMLGLIEGGPVVKAHSRTVAETGVVAALRQRGTEVVETFLGDWFNELTGKSPVHPVFGARDLPIPEILAALGASLGGVRDFPHAQALARDYVRRRTAGARYGLTGANAVVAATGSLIIMENEGNARLVSNLPPVHIAVVGLDKIVPDLAAALTVCRTTAVFTSGQAVGNYVSVISGPSSTGDIQGRQVFGMHGPKRVVVIFLDNGRRQCVAQGLGELLSCCGCGACLEACPHSGVYTGPGAFGAAFAVPADPAWCEGCRGCREVCPAGIDLPAVAARLRREGGTQQLRFLQQLFTKGIG